MSGIVGHRGLLLGATAGPPPGSYPVLLSVAGQAFTTAVTTHNVNMPATVNAGDLLIVSFLIASATPTTSATGFTAFGAQSASSVLKMEYFYKVAAGTEGGTTVNFLTSSAIRAVSQVCRIQAGTFDSGVAPESARTASASATPDPPNLAPSWGSAATLWIASCGINGATISAYPLPNNNNTTNGTGGGNRSIALCTDDQTTASLNPGTFTGSVSADWVAGTLAVKPV